MEPKWSPLGKAIKELREGKGLFQKEVCGELPKVYRDERTVRAIERGEFRPFRHSLLKFISQDLGEKRVSVVSQILGLGKFEGVRREEIEPYNLIDGTQTILSQQEMSKTVVHGRSVPRNPSEFSFDLTTFDITKTDDFCYGTFYMKVPDSLSLRLDQFTLAVRISSFDIGDPASKSVTLWHNGQPWFGFLDPVHNCFRNVLSPISIATDVRHMIIGTFDGFSLKLYVDGVLVNQDHSISYTEPFRDGWPLVLGWKHGKVPSFGGGISEVLISDRLLYEPQVKDVHRAFVTQGDSQRGASQVAPKLPEYRPWSESWYRQLPSMPSTAI